MGFSCAGSNPAQCVIFFFSSFNFLGVGFLFFNCYNDVHKKHKGNQKYCLPVTTNEGHEGPALDSRALAQDLTKVRLSLP